MKLVKDFVFTMGGIEYTIPRGFVFDGASIPKLVRPLMGSPFHPRYIEAALVHDFCCQLCLEGNMRDTKFRELLQLNSVSKIKSNAMYGAVVGYRWFMNKITRWL